MSQPTDLPPGMPPQVAQSPQLFFIWLRRQGYPQDVAMAETNKRFPTKPPDDIARDNQRNQLAQLGGYVGGTVGGALAVQGVKEGYNALFGPADAAKPTETPQQQPVTQPTQPVAQPTQPSPTEVPGG